MNAEENIAKWFVCGKVGASSRAMACCMLKQTGHNSHPLDPADFNRCLLFIEAVPEAKEYMREFRKLSKEWASLIDNWDKIENCFISEVGRDWVNGDSAPKTYNLMKEVLK